MKTLIEIAILACIAVLAWCAGYEKGIRDSIRDLCDLDQQFKKDRAQDSATNRSALSLLQEERELGHPEETVRSPRLMERLFLTEPI